MAQRKNWTREETLAAFALYLILSPGQHDKRNSDVIALADAIGRSPAAVVFKLGNIRANDPMRRSKGLTHGSRKDAEVWEEYSQRGDGLVSDAMGSLESLLQASGQSGAAVESLTKGLPAGSDRTVVTTTRVNQRYFRNSLLESYDHRCCFTGLGMDQLLVASHIKPWSKSDAFEKVSPSNGLLLNALHDRAFDQGLMTIDFGLHIIVSPKVPKDGAYGDLLWRYSRREIRTPKFARPSCEFIEYHNDCVFQR